MSAITKKQHYIPQFILKKFCNDKEQVYECLLNEQKTYPVNIIDSMTESYAYEHPLLKINTIEHWFSNWESTIAPEIGSMSRYLENEEVDIIKIKKLVITNMFNFLMLYYRSGALLFEFSCDMKNEENRIYEMSKKILDRDYLVLLSQTITQQYEFAILESAQGDFLLSDQFLSTAALSIKNKYAKISNRCMGLKDVMILIPISKRFYAIFFNGVVPKYIQTNKMNVLNEAQTIEINRVIISNSYKKCISYNKDAILAVLSNYKQTMPSKLVAGYENNSYRVIIKKEVFLYDRDIKTWNFIMIPIKSDHFNGIGRNDQCSCGSKKVFKVCCKPAFDIALSILEPLFKNNAYPIADVNLSNDAVSSGATIEKSIMEVFIVQN